MTWPKIQPSGVICRPIQPEQQAQLKAALETFLESHASATAVDAVYEASEEARRRLAGLGYLATTGEAPEAVTESLRSDGLAPQDRVGDITWCLG